MLLNIFSIGDNIGYLTCYFFGAVMVVATVYVMRKYLN